MKLSGIGIATYHTRVESWECDFNHHWNARYYARSFQLAAERIAILGTDENPGARVIESRVVRFHRELFVGTAVEVRSARIADGAYQGAIIHFLSAEGMLAATALDLPGRGSHALPAADTATVEIALPRTLASQSVTWDPDAPDARVIETGTVRPTEFDHAGAFLMEEQVRRATAGLHYQLSDLGFTTEFTARTGIGRMAVENRITPLGPCAPGAVVIVKSRISGVRSKSFSSVHWLETHLGVPIAVFENVVLAVDLKSRRAVGVPEFLRTLQL